MRITKIFAVLAAALLVAAFALGTLGPYDMTTAEALSNIDGLSLAETERYVRLHVSGWVWDHPMKAVLGRPLWLLPVAAGLIFAGVALSAASKGNALNSRRRRS